MTDTPELDAAILHVVNQQRQEGGLGPISELGYIGETRNFVRNIVAELLRGMDGSDLSAISPSMFYGFNAALIAAAPDLARLVLAKDAEIARLKAQIQDIKECWDWWQEDTYDRCSSVVDDAIRQAMKEETSDDGN